MYRVIQLSAFFAVVASSYVLPETWSHNLVVDKYGEPLGLTYGQGGAQERGELGILDQNDVLVFVRCKDRSVSFDESLMRRHNRNCGNNMALWPEDDVITIDRDSSRVPVVLTSAPLLCGICVEAPYYDVELPSSFEIIAEDALRSIVDSVIESSLEGNGEVEEPPDVPHVIEDSGGVPSGGVPSGGAPSGGAPSGGAPSGGAPSGGAPSGGVPSGGAPSGGAPSGGGVGGGGFGGL